MMSVVIIFHLLVSIPPPGSMGLMWRYVYSRKGREVVLIIMPVTWSPVDTHAIYFPFVCMYMQASKVKCAPKLSLIKKSAQLKLLIPTTVTDLSLADQSGKWGMPLARSCRRHFHLIKGVCKLPHQKCAWPCPPCVYVIIVTVNLNVKLVVIIAETMVKHL